VVYAKPAFGGPMQVLQYLGRYTHRVAISNHRLLRFDGERVTFRWKDYAHGGKQRKMTLTATEFLRRFFLHVLPKGFVRIRHFGLLAPSNVQTRLQRCRQVLDVAAVLRESPPAASVASEPMAPDVPAYVLHYFRLTGIDLHQCPACGQRKVRFLPLERSRGPP